NSTLTYKTQPPPHTTLFPYTTLFRSLIHKQLRHPVVGKTGRPCIGSEVLAVISAESGMRAKPQMAVVVLRNGDHRITSQSVFNGQVGERFSIISGDAFRHSAKPHMALTIFKDLHDVFTDRQFVFCNEAGCRTRRQIVCLRTCPPPSAGGEKKQRQNEM